MAKIKASTRIELSTGEVMTLAEALDSGRLRLRQGVNGKTGNPTYTAWDDKNGVGWDVGKTLYLSRTGAKPFKSS